MQKYVLFFLLFSCSSPKVFVKGGEYSQKEISYCKGIIQGYVVKVFKESASGGKPPALGVWLYTNPASRTTIINYVIYAKEKLNINFNDKNLIYQEQGKNQKIHPMDLKLTVAALSPGNIYSHHKYKIELHDRKLNQWRVYKKGLFGEMFVTDYKVVTMPVDQYKKVPSNEVREDFDRRIHEGIYVGEGTRIKLSSNSRLINLKVKSPKVTINGVNLPSQVFNFDLNLEELKEYSKVRCPSISDMFRWN